MSTQEKTNYKDTINLPSTNFSMKANLTMKEPEILRYWSSLNMYSALREKRKGQKKYVLHDGPPYANGHIHIGHVLNKTLKDFVVKFHSLDGFDCPYVPGWDCHGLPIEHQVVKSPGGQDAEDTLKIRKKCREYADKFIKIQKEEFERLGIFGDWEKPYLTMDYSYEAAILKSFRKLVERGFVYKKLRPIHWCCTCQTALAEAEVEHESKTSPSIFVKFRCEDDQGMKKPVYLLIWTTTPWTLPANRAVSVHDEQTYVFVEVGGEIWIMAETLVSQVAASQGENAFAEWSKNIVKKVKGRELKGQTYRQLYSDKSLPVVTGKHVTMEQGTGLVHTAPGHGYEDYLIGLKHNLEVFCPVNERGVFTEDIKDGALVGQRVMDADKIIIDRLKREGLLVNESSLTHTYPHCWRCKRPVIFRATEQWFINLEHKYLRRKALDVIKRDVKWVPDWGETRIRDMVSGRPDWCVSRQRKWGVAIPALYCEECGHVVLDVRVIKKVEELVLDKGADVWFEKDAEDFLPDGFCCSSCQKTKFRKETDILDVWFDSGVSHEAVLKSHEDLIYPADLYLEGSDQHRGWFQSALLTAIGMNEEAPFKSVLTHGFVVDAEGNKMSKSVGNVIKPEEIMKKYGADILRLWVASSDYTDDIRMSETIVAQIVDAYRKFRNTLRYILGNLYDFNPVQNNVKLEELLEIDKWAMMRLKILSQKVHGFYKEHQFYKVYQEVHNFCVVQMSAFYLDVLKDRLYTAAKKSQARRSGQTVLYRMAEVLAKILSPILSFTTEEFWGFLNKTKEHEKSIHWERWPEMTDVKIDLEFMSRWDRILMFRDKVLKKIEEARSQKILGTSLEARVLIQTDTDMYKVLDDIRDDLFTIFIVSEVELTKGEKENFKENIVVKRAKGDKCQRCWTYSESVGHHQEHTTLCGRCVAAIAEGE